MSRGAFSNERHPDRVYGSPGIAPERCIKQRLKYRSKQLKIYIKGECVCRNSARSSDKRGEGCCAGGTGIGRLAGSFFLTCSTERGGGLACCRCRRRRRQRRGGVPEDETAAGAGRARRHRQRRPWWPVPAVVASKGAARLPLCCC